MKLILKKELKFYSKLRGKWANFMVFSIKFKKFETLISKSITPNRNKIEAKIRPKVLIFINPFTIK